MTGAAEVAGETNKMNGHHYSMTTRNTNDSGDDGSHDIEEKAILVPRVPDAEAQERVHAAISGSAANNGDTTNVENSNAQEDLCARWPICCQVKIDAMKTEDGSSGSWLLTSLDSKGNVKTTGGDEFYIAYKSNLNKMEDGRTSSNDAQRKQPYSAVALIEDRQDGTYRLDFCATPTSPEYPLAINIYDLAHTDNAESTKNNDCGGILTVFFQYSCGIGRMPSPTKQAWTNGGYTHRRYDVHLSKGPQIQPFITPNKSTNNNDNNNNTKSQKMVDFNNYDLIVAFGDSTMEQFVRQRPNKKGKYYFQPNISFGTKVTFGLNTKSVSQFIELLKEGNRSQLRSPEDDNNNGTAVTTTTIAKKYLRRAVMVGSGLWDILDSNDSVQGSTNPDYADHRQACRDYLRRLRQEYPDVTILWKSPTAVHIHVVNLERLVVSEMGEAALFGIERLRYMSASRSKRVYEIQKQVVLEEQQHDNNLVFLDLYEATYLSADWLFPSDGRHYRPDLNRYMLQWFYPSSPTTLQSLTSSSSSEHWKGDNTRLVVSSDEKGGMFIDNIPKPYYIDPTAYSTVR